MRNLSAATRVFVAVKPVDLWRSLHGLYAREQQPWHLDPLSGHWFLFTNRQRSRVKILFGDGSGL